MADYEYIFKLVNRISYGLNMGYKRKKEVKGNSRFLIETLIFTEIIFTEIEKYMAEKGCGEEGKG